MEITKRWVTKKLDIKTIITTQLNNHIDAVRHYIRVSKTRYDDDEKLGQLILFIIKFRWKVEKIIIIKMLRRRTC